VSVEHALDLLAAGEAGLLTLFIAHVIWCAGNNRWRGRVIQFLKDKMGFDE
jgi:hypothetical protein